MTKPRNKKSAVANTKEKEHVSFKEKEHSPKEKDHGLKDKGEEKEKEKGLEDLLATYDKPAAVAAGPAVDPKEAVDPKKAVDPKEQADEDDDNDSPDGEKAAVDTPTEQSGVITALQKDLAKLTAVVDAAQVTTQRDFTNLVKSVTTCFGQYKVIVDGQAAIIKELQADAREKHEHIRMLAHYSKKTDETVALLAQRLASVPAPKDERSRSRSRKHRHRSRKHRKHASETETETETESDPDYEPSDDDHEMVPAREAALAADGKRRVAEAIEAVIDAAQKRGEPEFIATLRAATAAKAQTAAPAAAVPAAAAPAFAPVAATPAAAAPAFAPVAATPAQKPCGCGTGTATNHVCKTCICVRAGLKCLPTCNCKCAAAVASVPARPDLPATGLLFRKEALDLICQGIKEEDIRTYPCPWKHVGGDPIALMQHQHGNHLIRATAVIGKSKGLCNDEEFEERYDLHRMNQADLKRMGFTWSFKTPVLYAWYIHMVIVLEEPILIKGNSAKIWRSLKDVEIVDDALFVDEE